MDFQHIPTNGIYLHTALAGPEDGPPVILLHGFPEYWRGWEPQIHALAEAGFRVAAPDQRGYNLSDKPVGVAQYDVDELAADVVGLADSLGWGRFSLAGHDWGAMVAWHTALTHPERLHRLAIANVPHPAVMARFLRGNPQQLRKSWYVVFFQLPRLPEMSIAANGWRVGTRALTASSRKGTFTEEDIAGYHAAWSQTGAMTSMINWYRAIGRRFVRGGVPAGRCTVPTLVVWGKRDAFLSHEMAPASVEMCDDGRLELFEKATHWVQHEEAEAVSRLLTEHFSAV